MIFLVFLLIASAFSKEISNAESRIINGQNATEGQFPWQVEIMYFDEDVNSYLVLCGGAIISEEWILTAAICLFKNYEVVVYSGAIDLGEENITSTSSHDFIVHEEYDADTSRHNIGLIHLDPPLILDEKTQAISLSSEELEFLTKVVLSGYGRSEFEDLPYFTKHLQYTSLSVLDNSQCEPIYGDEVTPGVICAISSNLTNNPCLGDDGSPLVINPDSDPVHVGIFSSIIVNHDNICGEMGYPGVYTKTSYYREWIRNKTGI